MPAGSSSIGVFGGRGGGGGPGLAREADEARVRPEGCSAGPSLTANLPASAMGGGARNLGCGLAAGGEGVLVRGGELDRGGEEALPGTGLRDGGGAGGGPLRLDEAEVPVFSGLTLEGGAAGGGGGGGALDLVSAAEAMGNAWTIPFAISSACFCWTYFLMKSAFCAIWSSVIPIWSNSSSIGLHVGSARSILPELL